MRYYRIVISDPVSGKELQNFTSFQNGQTDPGAMDIELDVSVVGFATPAGAPYVRIWGVSLTQISQAADFNPNFQAGTSGKQIQIYGGMQKGLPLANASQARLLVSGTIQQAFGNWIGTSMTLDIVFTAGSQLQNVPANLTWSWAAGTTLSTMIKGTLAQAFPDYTADVNISSSLTLNHDEPGFAGTLLVFAQYVKDVSQRIVGGSYRGVDISLADKKFIVFDGTTPTTPKAILFTDLIGQPTWREFAVVQLTCVMRGDLVVGDYVTLPRGQLTTTAQSYSQARQRSAQQGTLQVISVRHVGRYRNPPGESWATVVDCAGPVTTP